MEPALRRHKSAEICRQLGTALDRMLLAGPNGAPVVAVYSAMGSEVDPAAFARYAEEHGATVAFPCMLPKSGNAASLQLNTACAQRGSASALRDASPARRDAVYAQCKAASPHRGGAARRGALPAQRMCMRAASLGMARNAPFIAHPTRPFAIDDPGCARFPLVLPSAIDLIVVPLVAFDARGMRLGYGGGCYDRYLTALRPECQVIGIAFNEQKLGRVPAGPHDRALPRVVCV